MQLPLLGRCLCGDVRYSLSELPRVTVLCHCTHCQRQSGSLLSMVCLAPESALHLSGETRLFVDTGDSGLDVLRHFCGRCGSPILSRLASKPGVVFVKAGTLDDWRSLTPAVEVYRDHAAPWLLPIEGAELHGGAK